MVDFGGVDGFVDVSAAFVVFGWVGFLGSFIFSRWC